MNDDTKNISSTVEADKVDEEKEKAREEVKMVAEPTTLED